MKIKSIILIMMIISIGYSAMFNRVNTVINTPAANPGTIGKIQLGFVYAPYYIGSTPYWEDDYYLNYHLTDYFILGITRVNDINAVGNMQLLLAKDLFIDNLRIAFGIENITDQEKTSTFKTLTENYVNNMTMYMVGTYRMNQFEFSLGFGDGRLSNSYNPYQLLLSNMFYSVSYHFSTHDGKRSGRISFEYDSKDYNFGVVLPVSDQLNIMLAATQLPIRDGNNVNYGNIPFENLSIGLEFTMDFLNFYGEEYNKFSKKISTIEEKSNIIGEKYQATLGNAQRAEKLIKNIEDDRKRYRSDMSKLIADLRKEQKNLRNEVKALRDVIEAEGFKNVQTLKEDIMKHYYRALRYYYDEKYFEAIEELSKAKLINSNIPEIHIRLGSIYWTLGLKKEALEAWKEAYELDQHNDEFNTFLKEKKITF